MCYCIMFYKLMSCVWICLQRFEPGFQPSCLALNVTFSICFYVFLMSINWNDEIICTHLREYCTTNLRLACFVCYLKIINTFSKSAEYYPSSTEWGVVTTPLKIVFQAAKTLVFATKWLQLIMGSSFASF